MLNVARTVGPFFTAADFMRDLLGILETGIFNSSLNESQKELYEVLWGNGYDLPTRCQKLGFIPAQQAEAWEDFIKLLSDRLLDIYNARDFIDFCVDFLLVLPKILAACELDKNWFQYRFEQALWFMAERYEIKKAVMETLFATIKELSPVSIVVAHDSESDVVLLKSETVSVRVVPGPAVATVTAGTQVDEKVLQKAIEDLEQELFPLVQVHEQLKEDLALSRANFSRGCNIKIVIKPDTFSTLKKVWHDLPECAVFVFKSMCSFLEVLSTGSTNQYDATLDDLENEDEIISANLRAINEDPKGWGRFCRVYHLLEAHICLAQLKTFVSKRSLDTRTIRFCFNKVFFISRTLRIILPADTKLAREIDAFCLSAIYLWEEQNSEARPYLKFLFAESVLDRAESYLQVLASPNFTQLFPYRVNISSEDLAKLKQDLAAALNRLTQKDVYWHWIKIAQCRLELGCLQSDIDYLNNVKRLRESIANSYESFKEFVYRFCSDQRKLQKTSINLITTWFRILANTALLLRSLYQAQPSEEAAIKQAESYSLEAQTSVVKLQEIKQQKEDAAKQPDVSTVSAGASAGSGRVAPASQFFATGVVPNLGSGAGSSGAGNVIDRTTFSISG